ncbi:ubiquitinyl hydrolase 1 [Salvia divinorum]|uniref:Ubiquitinyl hydrolase 1 n=1 Tax=Salvia divinorum TaxID=28513 RepID=A0ABD1HQP4_SALDI
MVVGFLDFVRSTSSMVLAAASSIGFSPDCGDGEMEAAVGGAANAFDCCGFCGLAKGRRLAGGEMVEYCSANCQCSNIERGTKCASTKLPYALTGREVSQLSGARSSEINKQSNEILFPYEEFIELFNWEKPGYTPCGLINGGNSCFANVVLQCLTYTRPLAAYFLDKGHKLKCRMDKWCFLCDFQTHVESASWCHTAFIPIHILSRLNSIGGNLERGQQEDAHEFMRFAIDKMQSVFLDEFGGEKTAHPRYQETSFVQHIFGGYLQSQVICIKCNKVSNRFDHMMDLTVEVHGDAESLEECLDQFTAEEWLHGDNMYKCDSCDAYVMARKYLSILQAPNILTIALKRFQKLNKRVTFPEKLDLRSYMNESEDGNDVYKLYAVIVHVEIHHTFGHYICYVKDFGGNWYKVDDDKVSSVGLDEVLLQEAYMLLYSRICARPSCLLPAGSLTGENTNLKTQAVDSSTTQPIISKAEADSRVEISLVKNAGEDVMAPPCDARLPTGSHDSRSFYTSPKEEDFPLKLDFFRASTGRDAKRCNTSDTTKGLSGTRCQDLGAAKNCAFQKDRRHDTSSFTITHVQKEKSANWTYTRGASKCEGKHSVPTLNQISASGSPGRQRWNETVKQENQESDVYSFVPRDDETREAAGILVGLSSEKRLIKPLSALGGKRRKDLFKLGGAVSNGKMPRIHRLLSENGRCFKYE